MSHDEPSPVLVDQNMNMITMGQTDRHNEHDSLVQSDKIPPHIQQDLSREMLKDLTTLKSPPGNGSSDMLHAGDVGTSLKEADLDLAKVVYSRGDSSKPFRDETSLLDKEEEEEEEEEAHVCESEADDRYDQGSFETIQRRVCLVKLYAWIKEEMSKTSARSVAGHLYQHERRLLSHADHESILHCSWRREAVEQLLKKVLMGPYDIFEVFIRALKEQEETHIATKLVNSHATEKEIDLFTTLEKSSLHQCLRPDHQLPRFQVTPSDQETLLYYLNNRNTIDSLSDHFLSRFLFSIREHTNVCQCSLDCERRVRLLLETMRQCADSVFADFCDILAAIEMEHVITKLQREKQGGVTCRQRQKRKVDTSQEAVVEEQPTCSAPKRRMDSSTEHHLVSSVQKESSALKKQAMDQLGFEVENINNGSIVIQLCPHKPDSWLRLKENCSTGKIKDFIPVVYDNEAIRDRLQEGEYQLQFTIYTLPTPPDSGGDQKVMFHLETEPEKQKEHEKDLENPIEDHMALLCEELEISKDLLAVLKKEKLVEASIKEDIDKQGSRAKKIKYLLKEVGKHGKKGYEVLKEYIREDNEDLYKELSTRDEVKVIDNKMDVAAKVNKRSRPSGNHRGVFKKEVFFTGVVVLTVKKKSSTPSKENLNPETNLDEFEISCPKIINPVCHFQKDKAKYPDPGEVTMVLEEAWSAVGEKPKPQRDILIGKRKKRGNSNKEEGSCKRAESEEKPDDEDTKDSKEETNLNSEDQKDSPENTAPEQLVKDRDHSKGKTQNNT